MLGAQVPKLTVQDNPDAWRTIKDHKNQREAVLSSETCAVSPGGLD